MIVKVTLSLLRILITGLKESRPFIRKKNRRGICCGLNVVVLRHTYTEMLTPKCLSYDGGTLLRGAPERSQAASDTGACDGECATQKSPRPIHPPPDTTMLPP